MKTLEIWGTLGPACAREDILGRMLTSGMNGIRLNLSHGPLHQAGAWIDALHKACKAAKLDCDLLIDMQGPEIRIGNVHPDLVLQPGTYVQPEDLALPEAVRTALQPGMELEIDDGKLLLQVQPEGLLVLRGGPLLSRKSLYVPALQHLQAQMPALTQLDRENLQAAKDYGVTAMMQPFVTSRKDLLEVRQVIAELAPGLKLYAKIENRQGLEHLEDFYNLADCIVIARGDLANDVGLENIALVQHEIETFCLAHNVPYMVVTQMLDSMIRNASPTRAEISDVFHAVYHGASAIMLTGETAAGKYPVQAMEYFTKAAKSAQACRKKEA